MKKYVAIIITSILLVNILSLGFLGQGSITSEGINEVNTKETIEYISQRMNSFPTWVMDESRGYIYVVSKQENKLLFMNMEDLSIEKEMVLESGPSYVLLADDKLYIALSGSNTIAVINPDDKEIVETIKTKNQPYKLAKYKDRLFYVEDRYSQINVYYLTDDIEKEFIASSYLLLEKVELIEQYNSNYKSVAGNCLLH